MLPPFRMYIRGTLSNCEWHGCRLGAPRSSEAACCFSFSYRFSSQLSRFVQPDGRRISTKSSVLNRPPNPPSDQDEHGQRSDDHSINPYVGHEHWTVYCRICSVRSITSLLIKHIYRVAWLHESRVKILLKQLRELSWRNHPCLLRRPNN